MQKAALVTLSSVLMVIVQLGCSAGPRGAFQSNLPISHEAVLSEVVSPCEWMVMAGGIGQGKRRDLDSLANEDARKAAINFVLLGGTDPLLQTATERRRFDLIKEEFFRSSHLRRYLLFESPEYETRVMMDRKERLKIEKYFTIDRCVLQTYLADNGIIASPDRADLGMPFIAVLPSGRDPVGILRSDPNASHAAHVIESHLTALGYDVLVPVQQEQLGDLTTLITYLKVSRTDNEYIAANSIGSDIHIVFDVHVSEAEIGANTSRKATANVRSFETTTARLLGSETGYSEDRPNLPPTVLIEEAMNDAVAKVLNRIQSYWKRDLESGLQFRVMFAMNPILPGSTKEDLKYTLHDILKQRCAAVKPLVSSENNVDYQIWARSPEITDFVDLQRLIQRELRDQLPQIRLKEVISNRKLVIYELE